MELPTSSRAKRRNAAFSFSNVAVSTGAAGIAGAIVPISTAVAGLILARSLPTADYGRLAFFFSVLGMVILFGSLGLSTQITTLVARQIVTDEAHNGSSEIANLIILRLSTAAL